jgi:hypothetical protein
MDIGQNCEIFAAQFSLAGAAGMAGMAGLEKGRHEQIGSYLQSPNFLTIVRIYLHYKDCLQFKSILS